MLQLYSGSARTALAKHSKRQNRYVLAALQRGPGTGEISPMSTVERGFRALLTCPRPKSARLLQAWRTKAVNFKPILAEGAKAMGLLWSIITWAVFGLIVGAIARAIYPGRQPMGILMTMVLGIVGSLIGGFVSWGLGFGDAE